MVDNSKDIIIAVFGASVALAGLLLIFVGFVFSQGASFPPETTDDKLIQRYERAGKMGMVPFVLALTEATLCLFWLLAEDHSLYVGAMLGFFLLLALTALYGVCLFVFYL